jgi:integrase
MLPETEQQMSNWMIGWKPTRYPGIFEGNGGYRVRVRAIDPQTGTLKEVNRVFNAITLREAIAKQVELRNEMEEPMAAAQRLRVGGFARLWIESKAAVVSENTLDGYTEALEEHVLPVLGEFFYDAVGHLQVQGMISVWKRKKKRSGKPYSVESMKDWFRVFRNMTRDAMVQLKLERDPTLRISVGDTELESKKDDKLTGVECRALLEAMERKRPGSFALAKTEGWTGQRFCHVSALQWSDIDFENMLICFRRKQVRGVVGPISKKKPVPREIPLLPELADTLRQHRTRLEKLGYAFGDSDWVFPSRKGKLRISGSLANAFTKSLEEAKIKKRITPHKLRYFFNDALRLAGIDKVTRKSLTGHVTDDMTEHYSTVGPEEKRAAMEAAAVQLGRPSGDTGGDTGDPRLDSDVR